MLDIITVLLHFTVGGKATGVLQKESNTTENIL